MALTRALVAITVAAGVATVPAAAAPAFHGGVSPLTAAVKKRMTPSVWRPGCPVPLNRLRRVLVTHHDFRGRTRRGVVVVNADVAQRVLRAFRLMYDAGVPIRRMRPIEAYGGDDFRSIEADNTSAFNCRAATGSSRWSQHAYGRAVDVNPLENPYVSGGRYLHTMSDHCRSCWFRPTERVGERACPFTTLYWDFLIRHEGTLAGNQRMTLQVRNLGRLGPAERAAISQRATAIRAAGGAPPRALTLL